MFCETLLVVLRYLDCIWFDDLVSRVYWLEWCLLAGWVDLLALLVWWSFTACDW